MERPTLATIWAHNSMSQVIFSCPFTGKTPWGNGFKSQQWFDYRATIFEKYTLKSLVNQKDKDFLVWLQFRPQEKDNPTTEKIRNALTSAKLNFVITFDSVIMYEDKAIWHNIDLKERADRSLKVLEPSARQRS